MVMSASTLEMGGPKDDQILAVKGRGFNSGCMGLHGITHSKREDRIGYSWVAAICGHVV